jgi:hypothetical protein
MHSRPSHRQPFKAEAVAAAALVAACLLARESHALSCFKAVGEQMRLELMAARDHSATPTALPPLIDVTYTNGTYLAVQVRPNAPRERAQFLTIAQVFRPTEEAADYLESTKDYIYSGCCTTPLAPIFPGRYLFNPEYNEASAESPAATILRLDLAPSRETVDLLILVEDREVAARYRVAIATFERLPALVPGPPPDEVIPCPWGHAEDKVVRRSGGCAACTFATPGYLGTFEYEWQFAFLALAASRRRRRTSSTRHTGYKGPSDA